MKKLLSLTLAMLLICSISTTALAAGTTTLTTTVPSATYTLNIPANQEIPFGTTSTDIGNVTVTDASGFAVGKNLEVTVTYDPFTADGISTEIPYTLSLFVEGTSNSNSSNPYYSVTEDLASGAVLQFAGKSSGSVVEVISLTADYVNGGTTTKPITAVRFKAASKDWGKALAGDYTTTITFTAEVVVETE